MTTQDRLVPAAALAERNRASFPNESAEYREARNALLAEEIELRRHAERVAEQRRRLPPGGEVTKDYRFVGENGEVSLAELFGDKDTLTIYSYMFGPQRANPCPMCTSLMASFEGKVPDIEQRVALAMVARSPIERLVAAKRARGWTSSGCIPTATAPSPAPTSAPRTRTCPAIPSSPAVTAPSATSGAARSAARWPTPARTPRRARARPALAAPRHHSRGPRHRLVPEAIVCQPRIARGFERRAPRPRLRLPGRSHACR